MGRRGPHETGQWVISYPVSGRAGLRVAGIGRMMRRMRDDIKENAGPIVLGVTFLAGLAWLLLGCGGATNPGFGTDTAPVVDDAGAGWGWAASPCSLLPSDTYCPGSASVWGPPDAAVLVAYWCSAGFSPDAAGCAGPLYLWDGGGVVAGQYCCR